MDYPLCKRYGLESHTIGERLRLFGLDATEMEAKGREFHERVIAPNVSAVVEQFYLSLCRLEQFNRFVDEPATAARLKAAQKNYLLSLGMNFYGLDYFEERLRIGDVHQRAGVPQSLYQCRFQELQSVLIEHIPPAIRDDQTAFAAMLQFILKITALDMSLAVESYCSSRVTELRQSLASERDRTQRLSKLAVTDWLTNLHNHSYSVRCLAAALEEARREATPLCVIMADLDHFKAINDDYGHLVGDEVLRIAAGRMVSAARNHDEICRYGGEEFLFILKNTEITDGEEVAERVRSRINSDVVQSGGKRIELTLSLGLAEAGNDDTVNSLIGRADDALYAAKRAGRDCVRIAPHPDQAAERRGSGEAPAGQRRTFGRPA